MFGRTAANTVHDEAAGLVIRSRLGDQNATAMIQMVAEKAKQGIEKAQRAYQEIAAYIQNHPAGATMHADISIDESHQAADNSFHQGRVALANGPAIPVAAVVTVANQFGSENPIAKQMFTFGYLHFAAPSLLLQMASQIHGAMTFLKAGSSMAYARALQKMRTPDGKVSDFHPSIGWELGE